MTDPFAELRQHRAELKEMFASKGWEIWYSWAQSQIQAYRDSAVDETDPLKREEYRVTAIALKKFSSLPFFLMEQAETDSAEQAPKIS